MKNLILLCSLILLFNACQVAELPQNPENDPQTVTVFALTGSTVAMDLQSVERFKNAKYFQITKQPANGSVGFVKEKMLLYVSDANANVRNTYFLLKSSSDDSLTNKPVLDTVRIHFTNIDSIPCTNGTLADYYTIQPNQSLLMHVLINDSFCSGTLDSTSLSIAVEPKNGTVSIENTSTSTKIRYTPIPNFAGIDQLVYKVCDKQGNC
ncbi:MAG: Ig-like domain-containing protein, partial [Verrucomicrobia bacterium]|nr:Ig-like domain-containing protein [Cytophagales bacterium]